MARPMILRGVSRTLVVRADIDHIVVSTFTTNEGYRHRSGMSQIVKDHIPKEFYANPLHAIFCCCLYNYRLEKRWGAPIEGGEF